MGVMLHLAYQTEPKPGVLAGQPSPVDGNPDAAWPWELWSNYLPVFARFGGTVATLPPVTKGASLGTGYDPYNHWDLGSNPHGPAGRRETRYGSVEDISSFIGAARALGMQTYVNVVHHHLDGDRGDYAYSYTASSGKPGRGPFDKGCFWVYSAAATTNPEGVFDSSTDWGFGREFLWNTGHIAGGKAGYVRQTLADALSWQTDRLDVDGYFPDDVKGTNTEFIGWLYRQQSMAGKFAFAELSSGTTSTCTYFMNLPEINHRVGVLDFPLRYKIRNVCNWRNSMTEILQEGVCWTAPASAVTFVENIDLDLSDPIMSRKQLAYALILALPGYPMVFGKDIYTRADGGYGLLDPVLNLIWCHETFAKGDTFVRAVAHDYLVIERMGDSTSSGGIFAFTTRDAWTQVHVQTKWKNQQLHDYTGQAEDKWTDANGMLDLWIPPDQNGAGRGHCAYAVHAINNAIHLAPRSHTIEIVGGDDLDTPRLSNGAAALITSFVAAEGTQISAALVPDVTGWGPGAAVSVSLVGGNMVKSATLTANVVSGLLLKAPASGTYEVHASCVGLPATGANFTLSISYTGVKPSMRHVP